MSGHTHRTQPVFMLMLEARFEALLSELRRIAPGGVNPELLKQLRQEAERLLEGIDAHV